MDTRFHCVYLLTSLDRLCEGDCYIGYTLNPLRRLRQHNGELVNGAKRTRRRGRPWALVCCLSGFPDDHAALKFEWGWQHPRESARLREILPIHFHGLRGLPYAIGVLHMLLRARLFARLELSLHVIDEKLFHHAAAIALAGASAGLNSDASLAPLTPHALLHIEEITPNEFQSKYLSHESASNSFLSANSPLSCPYDLSMLSQTVQEELDFEENSRGSEGVPTWDSPKERAFLHHHNSEEYHANVQNNSDDEEGNSYGFVSPPARSRRSSQAPDRSYTASPSLSSSFSSTSPLLSTQQRTGLASPTLVKWPRIPLRFKYYAESDFAREYLAEAALLRRGLLTCTFCALPLREPYFMRCPRAPFCGLTAHIICLAMWMQTRRGPNEVSRMQKTEKAEGKEECAASTSLLTSAEAMIGGMAANPTSWSGLSRARSTLVPTQPRPCALCGELLHWGSLIHHLKQRAVKERRLHSHHRRLAVEQRLQTRLERAHLITRKRRRPGVSTEDINAGVPSGKGLRKKKGEFLVEGKEENSREKSVSPPAIIVQMNTRVRGFSPSPARSALLAASEVQARQGIGERSMDPVEEWITADSTLKITDFDENEWLNY
ncbi:unnamed protein product [Phytomonas sp. Hart1]|nr:unnamed protein product [Phytomonas sp. Hart1]|eukprot:CCW70937.1 unnamed protein product [Phytomonas sp. isolate Hart1]